MSPPVAAFRAYRFDPDCTYITPSTTIGVCWKMLLRVASTAEPAACGDRPKLPATTDGLKLHFCTTFAALAAVISVAGT